MPKPKYVYVAPKVEEVNGMFYVDFVYKQESGDKKLIADYEEFEFLYQAEERLAEIQVDIMQAERPEAKQRPDVRPVPE